MLSLTRISRCALNCEMTVGWFFGCWVTDFLMLLLVVSEVTIVPIC